MANYLNGDVVLLRIPFTNFINSKVRPGVIVSLPHLSKDYFVIALTSRISHLVSGEFVLGYWTEAGLNCPTAVKRNLFTFHENLIIKKVGSVSSSDFNKIQSSLKNWLGL